jgi:hypothetical protein
MPATSLQTHEKSSVFALTVLQIARMSLTVPLIARMSLTVPLNALGPQAGGCSSCPGGGGRCCPCRHTTRTGLLKLLLLIRLLLTVYLYVYLSSAYRLLIVVFARIITIECVRVSCHSCAQRNHSSLSALVNFSVDLSFEVLLAPIISGGG